VDTAELGRAAIFEGLQDTEVTRLLAVARVHQCHKGECLFLLGDHADRLYVVLSGKVELTFPLSFGGVVRDVLVESKAPGSALGWSALVKPHRFTLSARAAEASLAGNGCGVNASTFARASRHREERILFIKLVTSVYGQFMFWSATREKRSILPR